jgi:thiamine-monophosphate kinase
MTGIGDDCAVLRVPRGHELLVTTDFTLEGVHFRCDWHSPQFIGHRCLTRGLSDIAAMGGEPIAAFLSLGLPKGTPQRWVDGFFEGLLELAKKFGMPLAGGDTTRSPAGVLADVVVLGSVPKGKAILRSGARVGDRIYVTGELGGAAAGLALLNSRKASRSMRNTRWPQPRVEIGKALRERGIATAMIDISDGLSTDLAHICEESGVGAEVWEDAIPRAVLNRRSVDPKFALHGGDAYELLFTAPEGRHVPKSIAGVRITPVGEIVRRKKISLVRPTGVRKALPSRGWEHFR